MFTAALSMTAFQLDAAISRNAELLVRLRRTIAQLHIIAPGHQHSVRWWVCPHPDCRKAAELLEIGPRDAAVGERRDHDTSVARGVGRADRSRLGERS
jgi:hypothetical protein